MSSVIKSTKTRITNGELQLLLHTVPKEFIPDHDEADTEKETNQIVNQKMNEIIQLQNKEKDLRDRLSTIKEEIKEQEDKLLHLDQELQIKSEQIEQQAYHVGHEKGYMDGTLKVNNEYEEILQTARNIITTTQAEKESRIDAADDVVIELAVQMARKIIGDTIVEKQDAWLNILKNVITEIKENGVIKVFVHPNQFELTKEIQGELEIGPQFSLSVYPDGTLDEFKCLVETRNQLIDASIDTQLSVLKEKLSEVIKDERI